ncbi:MAG: ric [Herbinix sp.]|jgi:regulator of cell morphogenesis and NO signaling|nr:ric [Herbinix sp.]
MKQLNSLLSIGEIVTMIPKASDVFKHYRIDFCCGGHRTLLDAIKEQSINQQEIMDQLEKAYEETLKYQNQKDFANMPSGDLIDYIVNTHHIYVKRVLPEISELTTTIMRVHGPNHKELFDVHKLFHNLKTELDQHLLKEEVILFPMMKEYEKHKSDEILNQIIQVTTETENEHDAAGDMIKSLRKITDDYQIPQDGCGTFVRAYELLEELEQDLFQHIHLENNILFKRLGILV